MSVQSGPTFKRYVANGVATVYAIPFLLIDAGDLLITLDGVPVTSGFTLAGVGDPASTCTFAAAPTGDLLFQLVVTLQRLADYQENGDFLSDTVNLDFDRIWQALKELRRDAGRALSVGPLEPEGIPNLPSKYDRANQLSGFDSNGNPVAVTPVSGTSADLALLLMTSAGAGKVGHSDAVTYPAGTVGAKAASQQAAIDALNADVDVLAADVATSQKQSAAIISNSASATARNITLIGDSISHGAFAINSFMHAWARIFNRMINAETGSSSYGFANWQTLGSGATETLEIHNINFGGPAWSGISESSAQAAASPTGAALRAGGVGSTMTFGLPFFENRAEMHYIQQPGGGTFTIKVNGGLVATVNTDGVLGRGVAVFNLADAGYGNVVIVVEQTGAGIVDIVGPSYLSSVIEPVFNNWSQSGRRLRYMGESIIASLMAESSTLIMALGHNDQGSADSDNTYYAAFIQRITWLIQYAKQYNVKVVVPDFCWTAAESSRARAELRRLAAETGGIYINLPKMIFSGDIPISTTHLIGTLKMWTDGSHPNKEGHKWIAETVARAMGLSCCTKKEAIQLHDFWMPLPLTPGTSVENGDLASHSLTSSYKRNGSEVLIKLFVEAAAGVAFPVGSYALTSAFNSKSELNLAQLLNGIGYVRVDTGAIVSVFSLSSGGAITLNVLSAFINDQIFSITSPIAPGTL